MKFISFDFAQCEFQVLEAFPQFTLIQILVRHLYMCLHMYVYTDTWPQYYDNVMRQNRTCGGDETTARNEGMGKRTYVHSTIDLTRTIYASIFFFIQPWVYFLYSQWNSPTWHHIGIRVQTMIKFLRWISSLVFYILNWETLTFTFIFLYELKL